MLSDSRPSGRPLLHRARHTSVHLLVLALLTLPTLAWAQCQRQALDIPVKLLHRRPIVHLSIEGRELPMLLDTGAFFSMLLPSTAAQLKLPLGPLPQGFTVHGYTGEIETRLTRVKELDFHGLALKNIEFLVGGNELGAGIMGILGRNILGAADMEYDLGKGVMRMFFHTGDCSKTHPVYWTQDAPVIEADLEWGRTDRPLRTRARINGSRVTVLMDTGAPRTALTLRAANRAGVPRAEMVEQGRASGAGAGSASSWIAPIDNFEMGGQKISRLRISVDAVSKRDFDLLLGLDYFLAHRIYVSRAHEKLYATWNGGAVFSTGPLGDGDPLEAHAPESPADDADALARQAAAISTRGDHRRALELLDRAIELAPDSPEHLLTRARVLLSQRSVSRALQDLNQALKRQAGLHEARLLRAQIHGASAQRDAALADLLSLDEALPTEAQARFAMANLYAEFGRLPEALKQWAHWLASRDSDQARLTVLNNRCWLRARMNQELDLALKDCEAAVALDRQMASHWDSLGWLQLRRQETKQALRAFDKAIEQSDKLAWAYYGRALAQRRLGDEAAASADLAKARSLRPDIDALVTRAGFGALAEISAQ